MKEYHSHDKVSGMYVDGYYKIDYEKLNSLKEQADNGDNKALNKLADMIIFHEEIDTYEEYIKRAAQNSYKPAIEALNTRKKQKRHEKWEELKETAINLLVLAMIVVPVAGTGLAWYMYDLSVALSFFAESVVVFLAMVATFRLKNYLAGKKYDKEHHDEITYGINFETADAGEIVKKFDITYVQQNGEESFILHKNVNVLEEKKDAFERRKSDIISYLKEKQAKIDEYNAGMNNIPGIKEFLTNPEKRQKVRDFVENYLYPMHDAHIYDERTSPEQFDIEEYYDPDYPEASAFYEAYVWKDWELGQNAIKCMLAGENYKYIIKKMHGYIVANWGMVPHFPYGISLMKLAKDFIEDIDGTRELEEKRKAERKKCSAYILELMRSTDVKRIMEISKECSMDYTLEEAKKIAAEHAELINTQEKRE